MKQALVIGRTNVGKTAFVLNFADYLGADKVDIIFNYPDGFSTRQGFTLSTARIELVGQGPHTTRCLQSMELDIKAGKAKKRVVMTDSSGFADGIASEEQVRKAVAQTLLAIRAASLVLHVIDASSPGAVGEVDRQIARFAETRGGYFILANKMDLAGARDGLERIRAQFPSQLVLPISATEKRGFREVKAVVARSL